ncbi:retrovirus-related pol polyprotein from transposon TNT 1-94 [Tanacetum coccineum]
MIQVRLNETVRNIITDNGTEFVNQTLRAYYEDVGISHQTSFARTLQQNSVAEAVATTCFTQNRSLIQKRHNKTPYELLHNKKPELSYLYVFGVLCYPTNDSEDLGKLTPKAVIGIFFGLVPNPPSPTPYVPSTKKDCDILFQPMFYKHFNPPPSVAFPVPAVVAPEPMNSTGTPSSNKIDQDAPSPSTSQTPQESQSPVITSGVEEQFHNIEVAHLDNDPFFGVQFQNQILKNLLQGMLF